MKGKWILYGGLIILALGILFQIFFTNASWPVALIICGVVMKVGYLLVKIKGSNYRPGAELIFLLVGLTIFFSGVFLSSNNINFFIHPSVLKVAGIILKVVFVILFMGKIKSV